MKKSQKTVGLIQKAHKGQLFIIGEHTIEYIPPKKLNGKFAFERHCDKLEAEA